MLFDLKAMNAALSQLEEERGIPKDKTFEAIQEALAAAYKKEYGKRGQIIRAEFDKNTGDVEFEQIKIVVDETMLRDEDEEVEEEVNEKDDRKSFRDDVPEEPSEDRKVKWNEEHHIMLEDAKKIKKDVELGDELSFPLEKKEDYGRIAAQTAKQVIMQKIREAEKVSVVEEYGKREGEIVSGTVQRIERGNVYVDLGRATGVLYRNEQIPGEHYQQGERIRAYLMEVEEAPRGINVKLSRAHSEFVIQLFALEAPEIASGTVEIKSISREPGSRTKMALISHDENIDAVGSAVGQRGVRVSTVISELGGEKIDIIEWSDLPEIFIANALNPGKVLSIELDEEEKEAEVQVAEDQLSLVIGKGGQNVRLAAKLTGWKLDIETPEGLKKDEVEIDEDAEEKLIEESIKDANLSDEDEVLPKGGGDKEGGSEDIDPDEVDEEAVEANEVTEEKKEE